MKFLEAAPLSAGDPAGLLPTRSIIPLTCPARHTGNLPGVCQRISGRLDVPSYAAAAANSSTPPRCRHVFSACECAQPAQSAASEVGAPLRTRADLTTAAAPAYDGPERT